MILGVILARGGSKRLPRKNLMPLEGVPLLGWAIDAARQSAWLDDLVVSSEDDEILTVAQEYGATAIKRPWELATDTASCYPALFHVLDKYPCQYVVLLQPTSPLRTAEDIDRCIALCVDGGAVSAVTTYRGIANGAVYVARVDWLRASGVFDDPTITLYHEMPAERSVDINTIEDFERAAELMRRVA